MLSIQTVSSQSQPSVAFVKHPTPAQMQFARRISERTLNVIAWDVAQDRVALSAWITRFKGQMTGQLRNSADDERRPTSKQVGFAKGLLKDAAGIYRVSVISVWA